MSGSVASFIDDSFLEKLQKLRILTKRGIKGPEKGDHRSFQTGEGLEFLDYRKYHPGDDLRYVDWSVYGRLDKLFIKLFHAEESQTVHLLLDMSRSMAAGSPPKYISALKIAAALSYICLSNLDKIVLTCFADTLLQQRPPARGKKRYPEILQFLASLEPSGETNLDACLARYAAGCRPGAAVIISDFFDPKGYRDGLLALSNRKFDVHLLQVLSREELYGPQPGSFLLTDVETGGKKPVFLDPALLEQYRRRIGTYLAAIRNDCGRYAIDYYLHETRIPFEDFLLDYLSKGTLFHSSGA